MTTQSVAFARYYEAARDAGAPAKLVANWMMGEISKRLNADGRDIQACPLAAPSLAALIGRVVDGTVSNNGARQVFDVLWAAGEMAGAPISAAYVERATEDLARIDAIIAERGLKQMNDAGALEKIVDDVIASNGRSVDEYRAGKDKAFNALVGQVMKASKGQANPAQASELLKKKLGA
jgi:aspartyl-tRNA(Asn)/glutamyl-tRNA(Gln) amidotransferase subunit B